LLQRWQSLSSSAVGPPRPPRRVTRITVVRTTQAILPIATHPSSHTPIPRTIPQTATTHRAIRPTVPTIPTRPMVIMALPTIRTIPIPPTGTGMVSQTTTTTIKIKHHSCIQPLISMPTVICHGEYIRARPVMAGVGVTAAARTTADSSSSTSLTEIGITTTGEILKFLDIV